MIFKVFFGIVNAFEENQQINKNTSLKHLYFTDEHIKIIKDLYCLHRNHQCFINVASMSHRFVSNERTCFSHDDIDESSILSVCSRLR